MGFISSTEAADIIGVSSQTIVRLIRKKELPAEKVGGRFVLRSEDIKSYLSSHNLIAAPKDHACLAQADAEVTAVSFFSGALGLDLGMELAGIHASLFCENDTKCRMTIASNRPEVGLISDIRSVSAADVFRISGISPSRGVDVMFGGPPCQAFSTAGARRGFDDERGNVFLTYLSLAAEIRPRYLVIENVRGLLSCSYPLKEGGPSVRGGALRVVLDYLDSMGYATTFNLYDAANFGAPQSRERVVLIAKREGSPVPWLTPTNSNEPAWGLPEWRTLGDALAEVSPPLHYSEFSEQKLRYLRLLGPGQYWRDLPTDLQEEAMGKSYRLPGGKTGFYRRLSFDRPCATLVTRPTMPATMLCHPTEDRPLAVEEYKAIQGFPQDWVVCGDINDQYRQIGNAVPVSLGEAIGRTVLADMRGEIDQAEVAQFKDFPYSRYKHTSQDTWNFC